MKAFKISLFTFLALGLLLTMGCSDDEGAQPISVSAIVANGTDLQSGDQIQKDLNSSTAAIDVPLDAVITITFAKEVDAATATTTTVSLSDSGNKVDAAVSTSGAVVTLTPTNDLNRGTLYTLTLSAGIAAADGGQFTQTTRTFTTAGKSEVVPPKAAQQLAYWKLDGDISSAAGNYDGQGTQVGFTEDRFGNVMSAGLFDGDASIAEIMDGDQLMSTSMTWSFWVFVDSVGHVNTAGTGTAGHFVMGCGSTSGFFIEINGGLTGMKLNARYTKDDGTTTGNDFFFNGDGKDANNGGWVGVEFEEDLSASGGLGALLDQKWAHIVYVYDAAANKRHLYINGKLMETDNLNNAPALANVNGITFDSSAETDAGQTIGTDLVFGFFHDRTTTKWENEPWGGYTLPGANHLKGALDDVRIFEAALTSSDVLALYNDEK